LRGVHGLIFRDNVRSCGIRKALNVKPFLLRIERSQLSWFGHVTRMSQERLAIGKSCWLRPRKRRPEADQGQLACLHPRPCLVPPWCGASRTIRDCWKPWGISSPPKDAIPLNLLRVKVGMKMNERIV